MKPKKILSIIMTFLMALSLLPSLVFASADTAGTLAGKLKIKGIAAVGSVLSADYAKVTPEGITDDDVTFIWSRKTGEQLTEVGKEKTYTLAEEDLGSKIELKITGKAELGLTGELKCSTVAIAATPEEAPAEATEETPGEAAASPVEEPAPAEEVPAEEIPAEEPAPEEIPVEEPLGEEIPEEEYYQIDEPVAGDDEIMQPMDTPGDVVSEDTENPVFEIGTEETLEIPEEGQPAEAQPAEEPLTYTAEAVIDNEAGKLDFGTLTEGFGSDNVAAQYVTIWNTGTGDLNFNGIAPEHFMAQDITETLPAGQSVSLWVQPREGVTAGTYQDIITYTTAEGTEVSFEADLTVEAAQQEEPAADEPTDVPATDVPAVDEPTDVPATDVPTEEPPTGGEEPAPVEPSALIALSATELAFGAVEEGADFAAQTITVTPAYAEGQYVSVSSETAKLTVTETETPLTYAVVPAAGQAAGEYTANIVFAVANADNSLVEGSEKTVTVSYTVSPAHVPTANVALTEGDLEFGTIKKGETPQTKAIKLTNSGDKDVTLQPVSNNFTVVPAEGYSMLLAAGQTVVLNVTPNKTEVAPSYNEDIPVLEAGTENVLCTLSARFAIAEADRPVLAVSATALTFESAQEGYAQAPAAQTVTLTNAGNVTLSNIAVAAGGQKFTAGGLSAATLEPNQTATFTVAPVVGLKEGAHSETVTITSDRAAALTVTAAFTVTPAPIKLTGITKPADIKLANGVEKSAAGLKLPSKVAISTNKGKMNADIAWNVKGCAYEQRNKEAQKFSVKGYVTLPNGVTNPDNLNLITAVNVSVSRAPKIADTAKNTITGIVSDAYYTTETKITFNAVGAGMDNTSAIKGDTRYLPLYWSVLEARSWEGAPYSATFRMGKKGDYTLSVTYNQQKFDGSNWANTGVQDTKQVNFKVSAPADQTLTPAANRTDANKKNAVRTGDSTPIMTFVIILVVAVVLIAGILVYRKRKNNILIKITRI